MTTALEGGEGSASRPGRFLPPGKTRYSLYRRLGGPQGRSGQVWKISPPPGFDPRTVQPIASWTEHMTSENAFHIKWKTAMFSPEKFCFNQQKIIFKLNGKLMCFPLRIFALTNRKSWNIWPGKVMRLWIVVSGKTYWVLTEFSGVLTTCSDSKYNMSCSKRFM